MRRMAISALALAMFAAGCIVPAVPVRPSMGGLVTKYKAPLTTECFELTDMPLHGEATAEYLRIPIFWLIFSWGDASVDEAARIGEIDHVRYADYEYLSVLGIYAKFTIHAYGN